VSALHADGGTVRALIWTTAHPTRSGYHWARRGRHAAEVVYVAVNGTDGRMTGMLTVAASSALRRNFTAWAGPIPEPVEPGAGPLPA
jgi:hypothetical protein